MSCSVVIPCHNGAALTRAAVQSLLEQSDGPPTEILLVDNGSSDDTGDLTELDGRVRVLRQATNLGFAGGVNRGIAAARGETILVLNNDTQAAPNLLEELHRALASDTSIGAVAPVSNHVKGEARLPVGDAGRDDAGRRRIADELARRNPTIQDVDTLAGLCLLLRRETFATVGPFDERFGHGNFEDDDLSLRLRLAGHRLVIARRAFLHHEGHATFRSLGLDIATEIARRGAQFAAKWRHHAAGRATLAAMRGNIGGAGIAALEAQRAAPRWLDADLHLARQLDTCGDPGGARTQLRSFLARCPEHVDAQLLLAQTLLRTGDLAAGRAILAKVLERHSLTDRQHRGLLRRLGEIAYEGGRHGEAAAHFRGALELSPDDADLQNRLGTCLLAEGRHAAAAQAFAAAIECGHALAHTNLGICRHALGDHEGAKASFERAVVLLPHDPVARANYDACVAAGSGRSGAARPTNSATMRSIGVSGTHPLA